MYINSSCSRKKIIPANDFKLYELPQEYSDLEDNIRKFTYSLGKNDFIFYLFAKKKDVSIFDELKDDYTFVLRIIKINQNKNEFGCHNTN